MEGAWLREEAMFLGVGIYLVVDNALLPFRTDRALRVGFVQCTEEARTVLAEARQAIVALVHLTPSPDASADSGAGASGSASASARPSSLPTRAPLFTPAHTYPHPHTRTLTPTHYPLEFDLCAHRLAACDAAVQRLSALVARQGVGLKAVVHEPVILGAPFPVAEYAALLGQFGKVGGG